MARIVLIPGNPWQLVLALSALKQSGASDGDPQETLVLHCLHNGPLRPSLLESLLHLSRCLRPRSRVVILNEPSFYQPGDVPTQTRQLRDVIGVTHADQIWLVSLWGRLEKLTLEAYPQASVIYYEDGTHTYIINHDCGRWPKRWALRPRATYRHARRLIREWRHPDNLKASLLLLRHLRRLKDSYLLLADRLPPPPFLEGTTKYRIPPDSVRQTLVDAQPWIEQPTLERGDVLGPGPRAIVLGQCFSNFGDLERSTEQKLYAEMIDQLQRAGYAVIWKEHPRTLEPHWPELRDQFPKLARLPDPCPWPIEMLVQDLGIAACSAISSTALFNFPVLFGLPSYTNVRHHQRLFHYPNDRLAALASQFVPDISTLETDNLVSVPQPTELS